VNKKRYKKKNEFSASVITHLVSCFFMVVAFIFQPAFQKKTK